MAGAKNPHTLYQRQHQCLGRLSRRSNKSIFAGLFLGRGTDLWKLDGVHVTSVGYAVSAGRDPPDTNTSLLRPDRVMPKSCNVVYDPKIIPKIIDFDALSEKSSFENHDPTTGQPSGQ